MRHPVLLLVPFLALAQPAMAQVTVNPGALDQLDGSPPPPATPHATPPKAPAEPAHRAPARRPPVHHPAPAHTQPVHRAHPSEHAPARPAAPAPGPAAPRPAPERPIPVVPPAPPPPANVPPPSPQAPAHPALVPPPAAIAPDAPGDASSLPDGVRVTFGAGRSDLNPQTDAALKGLAHDAPQGTFNVMAYAAGPADDPSTARRLSLSRALAVRSVLIFEGIPSVRIYVRALGSNAGDGPIDRVDVTRATTTPAPSAPPPVPGFVPSPTPPATSPATGPAGPLAGPPGKPVPPDKPAP